MRSVKSVPGSNLLLIKKLLHVSITIEGKECYTP